MTGPMVAAGRRRFPDAPFCQADAGGLPFGDGSFDIVVLRHVLEHLPAWLLETALSEAGRVARRALVLAFYRPPVDRGPRRSRQVGEGFLETAWARSDVEVPLARADWHLDLREHAASAPGLGDALWFFFPAGSSSPTALRDRLRADREPFKISIVLPTYHRPRHLARTLESIRAQTYGNWEVILVDNAGDAEIPFQDPRLRVIRRTEVASSSYARNRALELVTGDLVCFFDDDDEMFPRYLERFAEGFRDHPAAKLVRCGLVLKDGRTVYTNATPECCLRQEFATATWDDRGPGQDQRYFGRILKKHGWSARKGEVVIVREALCQAGHAGEGGLRAGGF